MYTILYTIMVIKTLLTYGYYIYILYPIINIPFGYPFINRSNSDGSAGFC